MKTEARQILIYELIKARGEVTVALLAEHFSVSPMTIRRDLDALEHSSLIRREYGKAVLLDDSKKEMSFSSRYQVNHALKRQIAMLAINHIKDVSSIYIDGSSTAYEFVHALPSGKRLTIFTNSAVALLHLRECPNINTFVIGGFLDKDSSTLDSEISVNTAKNIFVDATIISCSGFSTQGFFNNGITGSQIKKIMLENSQHNYLLADHTKFNTQGVFLLNTWDAVDTLVCDQPFDSKAAKIIENHGVEIITGTP